MFAGGKVLARHSEQWTEGQAMRETQRDGVKRKERASRQYRTEMLDAPKPVATDGPDQLATWKYQTGELDVPHPVANGRKTPSLVRLDKIRIPPAWTRHRHLLRIGLAPITRIPADGVAREPLASIVAPNA
jgi:hypothetical protein